MAKNSVVDLAVELSKEDWMEIYYALEDKAVDNEEWRRWRLRKIMAEIGPDGKLAASHGVRRITTKEENL